MHNTLGAVTAAHPFEEEQHPGPDLLKHENTTRNRINRHRTREKIRNVWLDRTYDGMFFLAWHFFNAMASRCSHPSFRIPIRPYKGGELTCCAVARLVAEAACAVLAALTGVFDALCAICELPTGLDEADNGPQILPAPVRFPASLSPAARRRARFGHRTAHSRAFRPPHSPQPSCGLCASATGCRDAHDLPRAPSRASPSLCHRPTLSHRPTLCHRPPLVVRDTMNSVRVVWRAEVRGAEGRERQMRHGPPAFFGRHRARASVLASGEHDRRPPSHGRRA